MLGENEKVDQHGTSHQKFKVDDNVRDFAVAQARRRYPAANIAAEQVVIYDLQRPGAFEMERGQDLTGAIDDSGHRLTNLADAANNQGQTEDE